MCIRGYESELAELTEEYCDDSWRECMFRFDKLNYCDKFHCIMGECPENCCEMEWNIEVDESIYELYDVHSIRRMALPYPQRIWGRIKLFSAVSRRDKSLAARIRSAEQEINIVKQRGRQRFFRQISIVYRRFCSVSFTLQYS